MKRHHHSIHPMSAEQQFQQKVRSARRVVALVGAGLSAASGLPIFRGSQPLWKNFNMIDLATPDAFYFDPGLVWQFYAHKQRQALQARPNDGHRVLAELSHLQQLEYITITQNDDGLHQRAGHHPEKLHEVQGSVFDVKCTSFSCTYTQKGEKEMDGGMDGGEKEKDEGRMDGEMDGEKKDSDGSKSPVQALGKQQLPTCPVCDTLLRPGVVWFGESLPLRVLDEIDDFLQQGVDLILVVGTSCSVYPANSYVERVRLGGGSVAVFNTDIDDDVMQGRVPGTWGFKGNAAETLPGVLGPVIQEMGR